MLIRLKRLLTFLVIGCLVSSPSYASLNNIEEQDGSPSVYPWKLKVSNGTLTNNGDGTASLTTGGGGGIAIGDTVTGGTDKSILFVEFGGVLSQDNTSLQWDDTLNQMTVTSANVTAINSLSGGAGVYAGYGIGRAAQEGGLYIAGGNNQFSVGATPGDITLRADNTTEKLFLGSGPTAYMAIEDIYGSIGTPIVSNVKLAVSADATTVTDIFKVISRDATTVFMVDRNKKVTAPGSGSQSEQYGASSVASGTDSTVLGFGASATGTNSSAIGSGATANVSNATVIGKSASVTTSSGQTVIGISASAAGQNSVVIGNSASASQADCIAIGHSSTGGGSTSGDTRNVVIGSLAFSSPTTGNNEVIIGYSAKARNSATNTVVIGSTAEAIASAGHSVVLGSTAVNTAANQFVAGSSASPLNNVYFGKGVNNATPTAYAINGTAGTGTNIGGGALNLAGGASTGNANTGFVNIQTPDVGSGGTSVQTLSTKMTVNQGGVAAYRVDMYPDTDQTANGPQTNLFAAGASITLMDLVFLSSDARWYQTDADAAATAGGNLLGVSLETKTAGQAMNVAMNNSPIRNSSWSFTPGATLYVSTSPGVITNTAPSGSDDVIRVVGFAISSDAVYFDASPDYLVHV